MQMSSHSTLNPDRSREALRKLREAAEAEADTVAPGIVSVVGSDIDFDSTHKAPSTPAGDPNEQVGAAKYPGQNSPHIGNGHGAPQ